MILLRAACCHHCRFAILPPLDPGPGDLHRAALEGAVEMAKHLRGEHDDEESAVALERWTVHHHKLNPG